MYDVVDPAALAAVDRDIALARGLPAIAYTSAHAARVERDRVLARSWTCIGFASDVAAPGAAAPVDLLGLPLLLMRDADATVRVFHNVCRHRGHRLVSEPCRLEGSIRCPYHSWNYGLDGRLRGTPHIGGSGVHEAHGFDRSGYGLVPVRSATWLDLVFVDLSGEAPPFAEHLAPLVARWEAFTGKGGLDLLRPVEDGFMSLELRANWKLAVENYCESYHLPFVHPGLNSYSRLEDHYNIVEDDYASGQGTYAFTFTDRVGISLPRFPGWPAQKHKIAEYIALFPNVLLGLQVDHAYAIVLQPLAHDHTLERVGILYVGEEGASARYANARKVMLEGWRAVFAEDVSAVEGMQAGRASPAFDGGVFSPVMDVPTHAFHRWVARRLPDGVRSA